MRCPSPSRCPYCAAEAPRHWTGWGSYERYAGDPDDSNRRVAIPRYQCKLTGRTFSLLPDELLPYCSLRTPVVLSSLQALFLEHDGRLPAALSTFARSTMVPRGTLRHLKARFLRALRLLRLPPQEGALSAAAFLRILNGDAAPEEPAQTVTHLFRSWKELEPKRSIVGIYAR